MEKQPANKPRNPFGMWARGIVSWNPANCIRTEFLVVWSVIGIGVALVFPNLIQWPRWLQIVCGAVLLISAGFINYGFDAVGKE